MVRELRALPPAGIRWSRAAWEGMYPDFRAKWWKAWPGDPFGDRAFLPSGEVPVWPEKMAPPSIPWANIVRMYEHMRPGPQPIPCIPDPDDPDYEGEPAGGIVGRWEEELRELPKPQSDGLSWQQYAATMRKLEKDYRDEFSGEADPEVTAWRNEQVRADIELARAQREGA